MLAGLAAAAGCATGGRFLDATKPVAQPEPGHSLEFGPYSVPAAKKQPFPLRVDLVRLDRGQFRRLDPVIFDVRLSNVSHEPVVLPWSPVPIARRNRPVSGYRHALFELILVNADGRDVVVDSFVLYGSPTVPNSLRRLRPGESVMARLPGRVGRIDDPAHGSSPQVPIPGHVKARVSMTVYAPDDPIFRVALEPSTGGTLPFQIIETVPVMPLAPYTQPPEVLRVLPQPTCADCFLRIEGYRLGVDRRPFPIVHFLNGDEDLSVTVTGNTAYHGVNRSHGPQEAAVAVPRGVNPGSWQLVVEADRRRSRPVTVMVVAVASENPLSWSDRTEVELTQQSRQDVVRTARPDSVWFQVPRQFVPGVVMLRARTWRAGNSSAWSAAAPYELAGRSMPPLVNHIGVGPSWETVFLQSGPDKPDQFEVVAGDELHLTGHFPVSVTTPVHVGLEGPGRSRRINADRINDIQVRLRLPRDLQRGSWRIRIDGPGMPSLTLPITMHVRRLQ